MWDIKLVFSYFTSLHMYMHKLITITTYLSVCLCGIDDKTLLFLKCNAVCDLKKKQVNIVTNWFVYLSILLSVCLSVHLFVYTPDYLLWVYLFVCNVCMSICLFVQLSVCISISVNLFFCLSPVCQPVCLPIYPFDHHLSVCSSLHLSHSLYFNLSVLLFLYQTVCLSP